MRQLPKSVSSADKSSRTAHYSSRWILAVGFVHDFVVKTFPATHFDDDGDGPWNLLQNGNSMLRYDC